MAWLNEPALIPHPVDDKWILANPLRYRWRGNQVEVPEGFITDLASIPRWAQLVIPLNGKHRSAAILHDYLMVVQTMSRKDTDRLFRDAMVDSGVPAWQRSIMYAAVRIFGQGPWDKNAGLLAADRISYLESNGIRVKR